MRINIAYPKRTFNDDTLAVLSTAPTDVEEGLMYINNTNDTVNVYYFGAWHVLHTISLDGAQFIFESGDAFIFEDGNAFIFEA